MYKRFRTWYWIGIQDLSPIKRTLLVDGLHLGQFITGSYDIIYIDSILSSQIVEGSYCPVNTRLVQDIYLNPHKYKSLFGVPYYSDFELIRFLDRESFQGESYPINR